MPTFRRQGTGGAGGASTGGGGEASTGGGGEASSVGDAGTGAGEGAPAGGGELKSGAGTSHPPQKVLPLETHKEESQKLHLAAPAVDE